ncbi:MAG: peptidase M14 [Lachnospiraceae bacterium]|nr:peptidase M14 [Lachnospiraceae bacterium]
MKKIITSWLFLCVILSLSMTDTIFAASNMQVSVTKQPDDKVKVVWSSVEQAAQYVVQLSVKDEKHYKTKVKISVKDDAVTTYEKELTKVNKTERYYIRVRALDNNGDVMEEDVIHFFNGDIVSASKQKYSYKDMKKDIEELESKYADYVDVQIIGKTVDNRNIYDVILGNPDAEKAVIFQASIHAREYMTSQLVMEQIEYYLDHYDEEYKEKTYREIFDKVCVHVVAMANPDGVTISQEGISGIRKASLRKKLKKMYGANRTTIWKANARGVDLNRQFDYKFEYKIKKKYKKGAYALYGGKKPVSEKETKTLVKLVNEVKPKAVVNYHAMGNVIYCNYGGKKKVQKKVYKLAGEIRSLTGYYYMGLDKSPGFANWLVCKKKIPSCTVEIGRNTTPVPISQFGTVWKQNKEVMVATARLYY